MGIIGQVFDPTGRMTDEQVNAENLSQLVDEMNRASDQLDAITNSLNIINKGSQTVTIGSSSTSTIINTPHGFGSAPIFLAFFNRSDDATNWYPFPHQIADGSGSVVFAADAYTDSININFAFLRSVTGTAITFTVSYYILQQPAQLPATK